MFSLTVVVFLFEFSVSSDVCMFLLVKYTTSAMTIARPTPPPTAAPMMVFVFVVVGCEVVVEGVGVVTEITQHQGLSDMHM